MKKFFYIFLDISGILLGVFLIGLGIWIITGRELNQTMGGILLFIGISAFIIHFGHYFSLKITKWIFGNGDYFKTRKTNL